MSQSASPAVRRSASAFASLPPRPASFTSAVRVRRSTTSSLRQKVGGEFILRIEDTDRERSDDAMTQQIQDALDWIGISLDEGPFFQSKGVDRHRARAEELARGRKGLQGLGDRRMSSTRFVKRCRSATAVSTTERRCSSN